MLAFGVLLALAAAAPAQAADFSVTRFDDPAPTGCAPGDCSLREAVVDANATTTADSIALSAGTYELTRTGTESPSFNDLDVAQPLTITGAGAAATTIDANGSTACSTRTSRRPLSRS